MLPKRREAEITRHIEFMSSSEIPITFIDCIVIWNSSTSSIPGTLTAPFVMKV